MEDWFSFCLLLPLALQVIILPIGSVHSGAVQITSANYEEYRTTKHVILMNFYADWCRFSQQLKPIFDKAADAIHAENEEVMLGKVNCDTEKDLCTNPFHVNKYPTLKVVRFGMLARREFRGQRTVEGLANFVREQIQDPVEAINDLSELASKGKKTAIIGYFPSNTSNIYFNFMRIAIKMRDDAPFYGYFNDPSRPPQIVFREEDKSDVIYTGSMEDTASMYTWIIEHCIPFVREITFKNGEEMTEEGLPLLILFYHPEDKSTKELFKQRAEADLKEHKGTVNCVTADGIMFAHPLHHLGKNKNDLPILAIDSFRHMFVFPNFEDIKIPGKLYQFVSDLHTGKLHKDFHNPPPATQQVNTAPAASDGAARGNNNNNNNNNQDQKRSAPPESTFKKLAPARSRYSFRDEL